MATIPAGQARAKFTSQMVAIYKQLPKPTNFLSRKFIDVVKNVDYVSWQVERYGEFAANDIVRGADGHRNQFSIQTEKVEQPPLFHEYFDIMQLSGYNRAFGSTLIDDGEYNEFMNTALERFGVVRGAIDRRYELQAAEVLQLGTITTVNSGTYDFKRKGASMPGYSAAVNFADPSVNPFSVIASGCLFNRTVGKASGGVYDCYMGTDVYDAFLIHPDVLARAQKLWNQLTDLQMPDLKDDGSAFMGQVSAGAYKVNIYTYPQFYTATTEVPNTSTAYIDSKQLIITPVNPKWIKAFAMVPMLPKQGAARNTLFPALEEGKYYAYDFQDEKNTAWEMNIKSSGLCIPVAVDQIWNAPVLQ